MGDIKVTVEGGGEFTLTDDDVTILRHWGEREGSYDSHPNSYTRRLAKALPVSVEDRLQQENTRLRSIVREIANMSPSGRVCDGCTVVMDKFGEFPHRSYCPIKRAVDLAIELKL
jgi:hypothetical protein